MRYFCMAETPKPAETTRQSNSIVARSVKVAVFMFLILFKALGVSPKRFRREKIRRFMEYWSIPMHASLSCRLISEPKKEIFHHG